MRAGRSEANDESPAGEGGAGGAIGLPCPIVKAAPNKYTFNMCFLVDQTDLLVEWGSIPSASPNLRFHHSVREGFVV